MQEGSNPSNFRRRATRRSAAAEVPSGDTPRLIDDQQGFDEMVDRLIVSGRVALDTEFHREGSYFPRVALLQFATTSERILVDPLAVDIRGLGALLNSDVEIVMHACRQDLEILALECGAMPKHLIDTQIAASHIGYSTPALALLLERELRIKLGKEDRLTDWMRRPLSPSQLAYAIADVDHLLPLWDALRAKITKLGRLEWVSEAFDEVLQDASFGRDPELAWVRIRELRHIKGTSLAVAQAIASWRERTAARLDVPVRTILADMGIVGLAQSKPTSINGVKAARGVEPRNLKGDLASEVLAVVAGALSNDPRPLPPGSGYDLSASLKPAVTLVTAWLTQLAKDLELDPTTLGTRADVEAFLAHRPDARLAKGWRAKVAGDLIGSLVQGEAAVAFDQRHGLILIDRNVPQTDVVT